MHGKPGTNCFVLSLSFLVSVKLLPVLTFYDSTDALDALPSARGQMADQLPSMPVDANTCVALDKSTSPQQAFDLQGNLFHVQYMYTNYGLFVCSGFTETVVSRV